jgi:hypothetical protein
MAADPWKKDKLRVMRWIALPKNWRNPKTFSALCRALDNGNGIHRNTVLEWMESSRWRKLATKATLLTLVEVEPLLVRASLENMLDPAGWQERIAHRRYVMPMLNDMVADPDFFAEVLEEPSDEMLRDEERKRLAAERLSLMPAEQREEFRRLLTDLLAVSVPDTAIITTSTLEVPSSPPGSDDDAPVIATAVEKWVDLEEEAELEKIIEKHAYDQATRKVFAQHRDGMKSVTPQGLQALKKKTIRKKRGRYNKGKDNTSSI